jgi:hypothetical protein
MDFKSGDARPSVKPVLLRARDALAQKFQAIFRSVSNRQLFSSRSAVYERLRMLVAEPLRTVPTPAYAFPGCATQADVRPPKLLRTYLALGAGICAPPAFDREFETIDFLTLMDLNNLKPSIRARLFES